MTGKQYKKVGFIAYSDVLRIIIQAELKISLFCIKIHITSLFTAYSCGLMSEAFPKSRFFWTGARRQIWCLDGLEQNEGAHISGRAFSTSLITLEWVQKGHTGWQLRGVSIQWCVHDMMGGCVVVVQQQQHHHHQYVRSHNMSTAAAYTHTERDTGRDTQYCCCWAWEEESMGMLCIRKKKSEGGFGFCGFYY